MPGNLTYYALVLVVIALMAALFGFGAVAGTAMSGAHLLIRTRGSCRSSSLGGCRLTHY
jgi:hypothetical protein